jgi:hypothetical protein
MAAAPPSGPDHPPRAVRLTRKLDLPHRRGALATGLKVVVKPTEPAEWPWLSACHRAGSPDRGKEYFIERRAATRSSHPRRPGGKGRPSSADAAENMPQ